MPTAPPSRPDIWTQATLAGLSVLLALRIAAIVISPLELYADEAQYWRWSQALEWGYYSKPPLIAWVIHVTTSLLGDGPAAIRIAAPMLHTVAGAMLFLTGRAILDSRAGFFAAFLYALMPGVVLSSAVLSTDGVLLPLWCAALYFYWQLRAGKGGWGHALALGAAVGAGMLAKYAMLYFIIGVALTALMDPASRRFVASARGAGAALVAGLILAPHFAWNAANDFETVGHTIDNANLGADLFNPENALSWFADQLGLFGPVSFLALLAGIFLFRGRRDEASRTDRWLLCFMLPVLGFILVQAVVSRAHANWTATAYPAAALLVAIWFSRHSGGVLWTSLGLNTALAGAFMGATALLSPAATGLLGIDNALKRTRGWEASAAGIFAEAERVGATAVLVDEREAWHGLDYYGRERDMPLISWRRYGGAKSFSERVPLEGAIAQRVLVASVHSDFRPYLRGDFETFEPVGQVRVELGQKGNGCPITRVFQLYVATGHAPPPRTPEWERHFAGQSEFAEPRCPPARADPD